MREAEVEKEAESDREWGSVREREMKEDGEIDGERWNRGGVGRAAIEYIHSLCKSLWQIFILYI